VVDEIVAAGGRATANFDNIASWDGGQGPWLSQAVDELGGLDILINNRRDPPGQDELQHDRGTSGDLVIDGPT